MDEEYTGLKAVKYWYSASVTKEGYPKEIAVKFDNGEIIGYKFNCHETIFDDENS